MRPVMSQFRSMTTKVEFPLLIFSKVEGVGNILALALFTLIVGMSLPAFLGVDITSPDKGVRSPVPTEVYTQ